MLPSKQIEQIKSQLISQIESSFPADKKDAAIAQIKAMNEEQLEEFLIQNNLIKAEGEPGDSQNQQCIFCSIVLDKVQSYKIGENPEAIAILEINPISKGHSIIIPKIHSEEISNSINEFAKKVTEKIKKELKPKKVEISETILFGHKILNVLPIYTNETIKSEKKSAKPEELQKLQNQLYEKPKPKQVKKPKIKKIDPSKLWLPKRIP